MEFAADAAELNDPDMDARKLEVLIDIETWRSKFVAERDKRMRVLNDLQAHPALAPPAAPDPDLAKGPLERECHLILREETARLARRDFEYFLPGGKWIVGGLLPPPTTTTTAGATVAATPAPATPFPRFVYQRGQWFEDQWLFESGVAGEPLRSVEKLHFERVEGCLKSKWIMIVGDTNALNMFRALQGRFVSTAVAKADDTGLFGDLDYLYEVLGGEMTVLMSFRYVGSHVHRGKAQHVVEHPHDTLRWINDPVNSDWDYANPIRLMPRPLPHAFAALKRPDIAVINLGGWAAASGVTVDEKWRSGEQQLASLFGKWLSGTRFIWKSASPVIDDAERNQLIDDLNGAYYEVLRGKFEAQVRFLHVEPFFVDQNEIRRLKNADGVADSRRAHEVFCDVLLDMLCVNV